MRVTLRITVRRSTGVETIDVDDGDEDRADLPVVGDWLRYDPPHVDGFALLHVTGRTFTDSTDSRSVVRFRAVTIHCEAHTDRKAPT